VTVPTFAMRAFRQFVCEQIYIARDRRRRVIVVDADLYESEGRRLAIGLRR
jgi:hypothetical protein